jgi:hypothetical protein
MTLFLTPSELVELTDRQTSPAQVKRLQKMGIQFIYRPGGRVKVARSALPSQGHERSAAASQYATEPDFSGFEHQG